MDVKQPDAPASDGQLVLLRILLRQQGLYDQPVGRGLRDAARQHRLTKGEAHQAINLLKGQVAA